MLRILKNSGFFLIDESIQVGGSFKWRGLLPQISRLRDSYRAGGSGMVVTFSSGNHGVAVGVAAQKASLKAVVVVPKWIEQVKVNLLRQVGCIVVDGGGLLMSVRQRQGSSRTIWGQS